MHHSAQDFKRKWKGRGSGKVDEKTRVEAKVGQREKGKTGGAERGKGKGSILIFPLHPDHEEMRNGPMTSMRNDPAESMGKA